MTNSTEQPVKRRLLKLMALLPWMAGCGATARKAEATDGPRKRFKGIGVVLVVDAVPGAEMEGVVFYDDRGGRIYAKSLVARRNREIMGLGGSRVPLTVRAVWRDNPKPVWGKLGGIDYEGAIIGDYTIAVAERIPDEVLDDIRAHRGALRLKFRLKPDGVLFGWDIQRDGAGTEYIFRYDMPGGDFKQARIFNGKPVEPGWEILPDGRKISTDY